MAVIKVTRWTANLTEGVPVGREAAAIVKHHGAVSVRMGNCYGGPHAGQLYIAITFADWASFGSAEQALAADANFRGAYASGCLRVAGRLAPGNGGFVAFFCATL